MTTPATKSRKRFVPHTHPECYVETDPLDRRIHLLHVRKSDCERSWCTFADHYDWAQIEHVDAARRLVAEIAATDEISE